MGRWCAHFLRSREANLDRVAAVAVPGDMPLAAECRNATERHASRFAEQRQIDSRTVLGVHGHIHLLVILFAKDLDQFTKGAFFVIWIMWGAAILKYWDKHKYDKINAEREREEADEQRQQEQQIRDRMEQRRKAEERREWDQRKKEIRDRMEQRRKAPPSSRLP